MPSEMTANTPALPPTVSLEALAGASDETGFSHRRAARRRPRGPAALLTSGMLWLYAAVAAMPLLTMVLNSFRTNNELATDPLGLPADPSLAAYQEAWIEASFSTYFVNSIVVTVASVLLSTVVSLLAAYALARSRSRLLAVVEQVFISGLMMPVFLMIVPIFYLMDSLSLVSTRTGLILVYAAVSIPFSVFVLTTFFRQLPAELEEAACIDGAGPLRLFWSVMLPLVRPAVATVIVFRLSLYTSPSPRDGHLSIRRQRQMCIRDRLEEAACIDGAGPLRLFWSVMLPLVRPAVATVIVFR